MNIVGFKNCSERDIKNALKMCMEGKEKYKKDDIKWTILESIIFAILTIGLLIVPSAAILSLSITKTASWFEFALYATTLMAGAIMGLLLSHSCCDLFCQVTIPKKIRAGHLAYHCLKDDCKDLKEILEMYSLCEGLTQSRSYASFDEDASCISFISHNGKYGMLEHKTYRLTDEMKKNIFSPDGRISFEHYDQEYLDITESAKVWL